MKIADIILAVVIVALWNGYLIYKMTRDDKEVSEKKESPEVRK
jgi:hypothetical protein